MKPNPQQKCMKIKTNGKCILWARPFPIINEAKVIAPK
jgi:hypothetical protein